MLKNITLFSILFCFLINSTYAQPYDLKCEYRKNPIGIDNINPRLSWNFNSAKRNWKQASYQILVATNETKLEKDQGDLWNSGEVYSNQNILIPYNGKHLNSFADCWWKVRVWDSGGLPSEWSAPAYFKMGILDTKDWQGNWIASDIELKGYQKELRALPDFGMEPETEIWDMAKKIREMTKSVGSAPAVYLRKEFTNTKSILRATAFVSGLGLYELYINGKRVGDQYLDPAPSDYQKRVYYVSHDVTKYIADGRNALGVILGNGWFNLITPHVLRYYAADYISPPQLLMQLYIEYSDGTNQTIITDQSWKFSTDSPITFNCILGGESYDARKEITGWDKPGYDDKNWKECKIVKAPEGKMFSQQLAPVRKIKTFPSIKVEKIDSFYRFDLGIEVVGWAKVKIKGKPGQQIRVNYPGSQSHTLGRYQTCYFTLKGNGVEEFEPRFCYNGFRYIDITGLDYKPSTTDVEGYQVCTDMEQVGKFSCSNDKFTKLQNILLHTIRNYILHLPNDPTREKAAWTQDIENGFDVNAYNFDCAIMYSKWQDDFLDIIHDNGYVPPVAPGRFDGPTINGPWWGGMIIYNPWKIYQYFGDKQILEKSYPAMKKQLGYLSSIAENYILKWGLGDWLEPGTVRPKITPIPVTSTIGYYYYANILKQTAQLLGKKTEADEFAKLAEKIKTRYNEEFLKDGKYAKGSQASQTMSLYFGLVPEDKKALVIQRLLEQISKDSMHLNTGFVSTPILFMALSEFGFADIAYKMTTQNTYPSYFDMVFNKGNTVFKESWDGGLVQMPSFGGALGAWYYHTLAGIRPDISAPGFKKIIISPEIVGDIKWVKSEYNSIQGKIISEWEITDNIFKLEVTIPANTTALVYLPVKDINHVFENDKPVKGINDIKFIGSEKNKTLIEVGSGTYDFRVKIR